MGVWEVPHKGVWGVPTQRRMVGPNTKAPYAAFGGEHLWAVEVDRLVVAHAKLARLHEVQACKYNVARP